MSDIYLYVNGCKQPEWPSYALGGPGDMRADYLDALRKADGGDFGPLIVYTSRFLPKDKRG